MPRPIAPACENGAHPGAARGPVKEPIVYYLDPGTPEPARSALLDGAREEVLIANSYFFPGRRFRQALARAAAAGHPVIGLQLPGHGDLFRA